MNTYIKYSVNLLLATMAVFAPIKPAVITVMVLTIIDLITGVIAAKRRQEPITSAGFGRTIVKILVYEAATLCAYLAQKYLVLDIMPVCTLVTSLIGITELKSVLENLDSISGGSFFSSLITKLNSTNDPKA